MLSNILMLMIHLAVTSAAVMYMVRGVYLPRKLDSSTPSELTTLGILGTFVGIFIGLAPFIISTFRGADISENVPHLIGGISVAAICSIAGMSLALLSKHEQRKARLNTPEISDTGATADTLAQLLKALLETSQEQNKNLISLQKAVSGDEDGTLLTQMQKLRTSFSDKQDELIQSFNSFSEKMAKSNSEALIEALKEVIRDFNAKINEQFGDNFKQLNEAVGLLLVWQENYRKDVEELQNQFTLCLEGVNVSRDSLSIIADKSESIVASSQKLEEILVGFDSHRTQLAVHLEAFASLAKEAGSAFPIIENNLKDMTEHFSASVKQSVIETHQLLTKHQDAFGEMTKSFETLEERTSKHTDSIFASMSKQVNDLSEQMNQTLNTTSKRLTEQVSALDEALEKELKDSIESLGTQLTSLSGHFVKDYTPLTIELKKLVEASKAGSSK